MTLEVKRQHRQRPGISWLWYVCALLCVAVAGWVLLYGGVSMNNSTSITSDYRYTIDQSAVSNVVYLDNNLFDGRKQVNTSAYVRELTDTIQATFRYTYQGSAVADLEYTLVGTARVKASNTIRGSTDSSIVWEHTYPLVPPTTKKLSTQNFTINETVSIPFREYSLRVAGLNSTLALTLDGVVETMFTVSVSGVKDGQRFNNSQTMTLTSPLTEAVYTPKVAFEKQFNSAAQVATKNITQGWQQFRGLIASAIILFAIGLVIMGVHPWRNRYFGRTPYQRALARIYRYHDGMIIKTNQPIDIKGREVISVESFDDLLSLSEELRVPIIAGEISDEATRFVILHEVTIYTFLLGHIVAPQTETPFPVRSRSSKK